MTYLELKIEDGELWIEERPSRFHHATPTFNTHVFSLSFVANHAILRTL